MKKLNLRKLALSAVLIALGTVLSLVKIFTMPLGGAVTLFSMLPVCLIAILYGTKWGFFSAFIYSVGQLFLSLSEVLSWGMSSTAVTATLFLDYIIPFTLLGIAGIFRKKGIKGIIAGITLALFLRFTCHFISGVVIFDIWCPWANVYLYSVCYNGLYMLPELAFTVAGAYLLFKSKTIENIIKITN